VAASDPKVYRILIEEEPGDIQFRQGRLASTNILVRLATPIGFVFFFGAYWGIVFTALLVVPFAVMSVVLGSPFWLHAGRLGDVGVFGFLWGLFCGYVCGILMHGVAEPRNFLSLKALWAEGAAPFRYEPFLNFTVDRLFLRRVGRGYVFTHRMLLEHFASLRNAVQPEGSVE